MSLKRDWRCRKRCPGLSRSRGSPAEAPQERLRCAPSTASLMWASWQQTSWWFGRLEEVPSAKGEPLLSAASQIECHDSRRQCAPKQRAGPRVPVSGIDRTVGGAHKSEHVYTRIHRVSQVPGRAAVHDPPAVRVPPDPPCSDEWAALALGSAHHRRTCARPRPNEQSGTHCDGFREGRSRRTRQWSAKHDRRPAAQRADFGAGGPRVPRKD